MTEKQKPTQGQMILVAKDLETFRRAIMEMELGRRAQIAAVFGVEAPDSVVAIMGAMTGVLGAYMHDVMKPGLPESEYNAIISYAMQNLYAAAFGVRSSQVDARFVVRKEEEPKTEV